MNEVRCRVVTQEKGFYKVNYEGKERLREVSGKYRYNTTQVSDYPAVGDYCLATWPDDDSNCTINMLFPRKSVFIRKAAGEEMKEQVVRANIDVVFVCMSLNRDYSIRRLERYISIAWDSGAVPVVVLTKADLCENLGERLSEVSDTAPGVDICVVSSFNDDTEQITKYLTKGSTIAFLGSSGVGKSTLINKLMGNEILKTNEIGNEDKGRHTTTHRQLLELPCGAFVIDTPGMRELGMWDNETGIETAFRDIEGYITLCRFSDCTHTNEPGCAVIKAIADGKLSKKRWDSYLKLKNENQYAVNEAEYIRAKNEKFRQISIKNKKNRH